MYHLPEPIPDVLLVLAIAFAVLWLVICWTFGMILKGSERSYTVGTTWFAVSGCFWVAWVVFR